MSNQNPNPRRSMTSRPSQVRFADDTLLPRRSTPPRMNYDIAPNAVVPHAYPNMPSPPRTSGTANAEDDYVDSADITEHGLYRVESEYEGPDRFSTVPFNITETPMRPPSPQMRTQEWARQSQQAYLTPLREDSEAPSRRQRNFGSDETLTEFGEQPMHAKKGSFDSTRSAPRKRSHSTDQWPQHFSPRSSRDMDQSHFEPARPRSRDIERTGSRGGDEPRRGGILNHLREGFKNFSQDLDGSVVASMPNSRAPSAANSRRNSWSGNANSGRRGTLPENKKDNFERSMAINADAEETYLLDDRPHRSVHEAVLHPNRWREEKDKPQEAWNGGRRKSYSERRKREKHRIIYHPEPMEEYQKFILMFAKALLAFGSPSHRIEAQLNSLTKVFEMEAQFQHTPGTIQVSFGNPEARCSETCLIKSPVGLALGRVFAIHNIYRAVLHDDMHASQGTRQLRKLLDAKPRYGHKTRFILSYITCCLICGVAFGGSLNDMWVAGVMGLVVRFMQNIASKSELSASGSEVFTAAIVSLVARALSTVKSQIWCFTSISSSGVISLLPGYLILSGSLDIAGKNQALGAPKIVSGIMTSLYLGFGLTLGSDVFLFLDRPASRVLSASAPPPSNLTTIQGFFHADNGTSPTDSFTGTFSFANSSATVTEDNIVKGCYRDPSWGWYLQPMPFWSLFFLVPMFALCASMNNQQHWWSRQMLVMVSIACIAFWITRLCDVAWGLHEHPDYISLIGSWVVGILGNGYSRRFGGTAFTAMLTGILLLVPDGLAAAGGLAQNYQSAGQDEYTQSLTLARKMISVIIGIMAGVYSSAAIIYLFGKKKNAALVTF